MEAQEQLRDAVCSYCYSACRAITACRELARVLALLQAARGMLLERDSGGAAPAAHADGDDELAARGRAVDRAAAAVAAAAADAQQEQQLVRRVFYASAAFQEVADALLTGASRGASGCTRWRPALTRAARTGKARTTAPPTYRCPAAVVAPDWLPRFSDQERHQAYTCWFEWAPAHALVLAVSRRA